MELKINNSLKHFQEAQLSLLALAQLELGDKQTGVAIAVNETVIPKSEWNNYQLKANDDILIIKATQGG